MFFDSCPEHRAERLLGRGVVTERERDGADVQVRFNEVRIELDCSPEIAKRAGHVLLLERDQARRVPQRRVLFTDAFGLDDDRVGHLELRLLVACQVVIEQRQRGVRRHVLAVDGQGAPDVVLRIGHVLGVTIAQRALAQDGRHIYQGR
jgi:hypothetical protein